MSLPNDDPVVESFTGSLPTMISEAPSARAWRTTAKPIPELPPITTTFLPSSSMSDLSNISSIESYCSHEEAVSDEGVHNPPCLRLNRANRRSPVQSRRYATYSEPAAKHSPAAGAFDL